MHKYLRPLMQLVEKGDMDTTFIITHRMALDDAPMGYKIFDDKQDGCVKIVMKPQALSQMTH